MKLPPLYKRTRTGAIQYWEIVVTQQEDYGVITKTSGQYGTDKPLENVEFVTEGKNQGRSNATTPLEQAKRQAESDWKKKRDDGYKSLDDLGIEWDDQQEDWKFNGQHYWLLSQVLEAALPKYNTDSNGNTKPMLAKAVNWKKVTYNCYVQPKYDGCRTLLVFDGSNITFLSRTGKEYTTLNHIKEEALTRLTEPIILDGEVYSHELTFQEIVAAVKKQRDDTLKLQFRVYDVVNDQPQEERLKVIQPMQWRYIVSVPTMSCANKEEVESLHLHYVSQGYEGVMIRLANGSYDQGQRSSNLLKVKEFDTNEYPFLEFELGQRGVEDLIAVCSAKSDGVWHETFKAKMQGTVVEKQSLFNNQPAQLSQLTIKHHGFTNDGLPRFPIGIAFRDYE